MNEEALKHAHSLFVKDGYDGSLEDYRSLISTNKEALDYSYDLFKKDGYKNSSEDFYALLGVKKKEDTVLDSGGPARQPAAPSQESGKVEAYSGGFSRGDQGFVAGTRPGTGYKKPAQKKPDVLQAGKKKPPIDWRSMAQEMKGQEVVIATPSDITQVSVPKPIEIQKKEIQQYNVDQEKQRAADQRLSERMQAGAKQAYNRQAEYLGIYMQPKGEEISAVEMQKMYDNAIAEAQSYISFVPESRTKSRIGDIVKQIEANEAEPSQIPDTEQAKDRLRRKSQLLAELDREYRAVEDYAMEYWKRSNPGKYELYNNRIKTIRSYSDVPAYDVQGSENITGEDKRFLDQFRAEAMSLKVNADKYVASKIIDNYDIKGMTKDVGLIDKKIEEVVGQIKEKESVYKLDESRIVTQHKSYSEQIKNINSSFKIESEKLMQYMNEDGTLKEGADVAAAQRQLDIVQGLNQKAEALKSKVPNIYDETGKIMAPTSSGPLKQLYDQYNTLMDEKKKLYDSYGVTSQVMDELNTALDGLESAQKSLAYAVKFKDNISDKAMARVMQNQKISDMQSGSFFDKAYWVATDISRGFANMTLPVLEVPKLASDLMGFDQEKGWTDYLSDFSENVMNTVGDRTRISEDIQIPTWMKVVQDTSEGFGSAIGFGMGGMTAGGIAKGLNMTEKAVKSYQKAGVFSTAFLSSVNSNYVQAMENGLSQEEAALAAVVKSGMDASLELIVPDYKIFKEAARANIYSSIKELGLKQGVKSWAPQYMRDVANSYAGEFIEESAADVGASYTGMLINLTADKKVYSEEFKLNDLLYTGLTGGNVGALMESVRLGHEYKHPITKSMQRQYGEMTPDQRQSILDSISEEDLIKMGELDKEGLAEISEGLKSLPGYNEMTDFDKDDVFSLVLSREQAKKAYKELGLMDSDRAKEDIASYDDQINNVFKRSESERQALQESRIKVVSELAPAVYPEITEVENIMSRGDFADDTKVEAAVTGLNKIIDDILDRDDLTDDEKIQVAQVIEDRKSKIDGYEYRSKNEVSIATQNRPSGIVEKARAANERGEKPIAAAAKENVTIALDGVKGTIKLSDSTMVDNMGDTIPEGYYVFIPEGKGARAERMGAVVIGSVEDIDSGAQFESVDNNPSWSPENNIVANIKTRDGQMLSILDDDLSADVGIKQKENVLGAAPQALFDVVFEEVTTELGIKEKPYLKINDKENQQGLSSVERGGQAPVQAQPDQEASASEVAPSGVVQEQAEVVSAPEPLRPEPPVKQSESSPFEYTRSRAIGLKDRAKTDPVLRRSLNNLDKAASAFKKTFGVKTPVFVYDTQRQMLDDVEAVSGQKIGTANGAILFDDDGEVVGVYMNAESQDFTVGPHEFVHAVLAKTFDDNPEMYSKWKDSILRNIKGSDIERLRIWAETEYDKDSSAEEFITQLTAELADTNKQLEIPKSLLNSVKDLFNSIWESVTGVPLFNERATDKDVVRFINDMAAGLSSGQAIDLLAAERLKKKQKKPSKQKPKISKSQVSAKAEFNKAQINKINALASTKKFSEDAIASSQMMDEMMANNPQLDFIINNFDRIEKALVKEGKLKVNCEL